MTLLYTGQFLGYGFPIFFLKRSLVLAAIFHVSTTRYATFQRASDLDGLFWKDKATEYGQ